MLALLSVLILVLGSLLPPAVGVPAPVLPPMPVPVVCPADASAGVGLAAAAAAARDEAVLNVERSIVLKDQFYRRSELVLEACYLLFY